MAEVRPSNEGESRVRLIVLSVIAVVVQLVALYTPGSAVASIEVPGLDKVVHALLFAVPVWLLGRLTSRRWLVALVFALHAVVSELVQYFFIPNRDGDPFDLLADLVGILAAVLLLTRVNRGDGGG